MSEEKKIIIDEDWKSQVEAEQEAAEREAAKQKEQASESVEPEAAADAPAEATADSPADTTSDTAADSPAESPIDSAEGTEATSPEDPAMPPASLGMLMSSLATEALISMGQFPHPATGESVLRKNQAKYLVDTLEMLKEKTKGNLTSEEETALSDVLHQLRMAFIQIV